MTERNMPETTNSPTSEGLNDPIAIEIDGKADIQTKKQSNEAEIIFEVKNYVYKKVYEEWLETRIVEKANNLVTVYILKTHSMMNCHLMDLFPSTIETLRKFKISSIKPQMFYNNPKYIKIATDNTVFDMKYDLNTLLEYFKMFLLKNKSTIYIDELEQFTVYVKNIFVFYQQNIFTLDEQRRLFLEKEGHKRLFQTENSKNPIKETCFTDKETCFTNKDTPNRIPQNIECHPVHILRLCIFWHFLLRNNISHDEAIETGYEFFFYLTDWVVFTFFN